MLRRVADRLVIPAANYVVRRAGFRQDVVYFANRRAAQESADFWRDEMPGAMLFESRDDLLRLSLSHIPSDGLVLEFGVWKARGANFIASIVAPRQVHGFDSFEGLKEAWSGTGMLRGHFSLGGDLPKVRDNVTLHKGWFDVTLPKFLDANQGPVAFAHIDSDTYEAAQVVLQTLAPRIGPGTVIQFDEYLGYPRWQDHEHRAWAEFVAEHGVQFRYLGVGSWAAAIQVL